MPRPSLAWITARLRALADALAPRGCVACGDPVALDPLCALCAVSLIEAPDPLPGILVAHEHGGALARAVYRAKYDGDPTRGRRLGALLLPLTAQLARPVGCVIPVPLHPRRLRQRGYNQSMELARPVALALGCPLLAEGLVRLRDTPTQTTLARAARDRDLGAGRAEPRHLGGDLREARHLRDRGLVEREHPGPLAEPPREGRCASGSGTPTTWPTRSGRSPARSRAARPGGRRPS